MRFDSLIALAPVVGLAAAYEETIRGFKFIHTGPKVDAPKASYEKAAADKEIKLLTDRLGAEGVASVLQPETDADNARCLYLKDGSAAGGEDPDATTIFCITHIKKKLGDEGLEKLLLEDIAAADAFWEEIDASSTSKITDREPSGAYVSADVNTFAFIPGLPAALFGLWTQSPLSDKAYIDCNVEHYWKHATSINATTSFSRIFEGAGGINTNFTVPDNTVIAPGSSTKYPFIHPREKFLIQSVGGKTLLNGLVFGALHIAVRDVLAAEALELGSAIPGIEIAASVWYGNAMKDEDLEWERQHIVNEMVNFAFRALEDITAGLLPIPTATAVQGRY